MKISLTICEVQPKEGTETELDILKERTESKAEQTSLNREEKIITRRTKGEADTRLNETRQIT